MTSYKVLRTEDVPDILKGKPRWVICTMCVVSLFILTTSAVAAGAIIGYTYCYVENKSGLRPVNNTQTKGLPSDDATFNNTFKGYEGKTINEALYKLVQKILKIPHNIWDEDKYFIPWIHQAKKVERETVLR